MTCGIRPPSFQQRGVFFLTSLCSFSPSEGGWDWARYQRPNGPPWILSGDTGSGKGSKSRGTRTGRARETIGSRSSMRARQRLRPPLAARSALQTSPPRRTLLRGTTMMRQRGRGHVLRQLSSLQVLLLTKIQDGLSLLLNPRQSSRYCRCRHRRRRCRGGAGGSLRPRTRARVPSNLRSGAQLHLYALQAGP